jgi:hypothetical protein
MLKYVFLPLQIPKTGKGKQDVPPPGFSHHRSQEPKYSELLRRIELFANVYSQFPMSFI